MFSTIINALMVSSDVTTMMLSMRADDVAYCETRQQGRPRVTNSTIMIHVKYIELSTSTHIFLSRYSYTSKRQQFNLRLMLYLDLVVHTYNFRNLRWTKKFSEVSINSPSLCLATSELLKFTICRNLYIPIPKIEMVRDETHLNISR